MELTTAFAALIPVVMGIVQILKKTGLPTRFAPLASLVLGIVGAIYFVSHDTNGVMQGIMVGIMASGIHSSVKTSARK